MDRPSPITATTTRIYEKRPAAPRGRYKSWHTDADSRRGYGAGGWAGSVRGADFTIAPHLRINGTDCGSTFPDYSGQGCGADFGLGTRDMFTESPTAAPSGKPTRGPSTVPTSEPSSTPTAVPVEGVATGDPSAAPTFCPTSVPSSLPSFCPTT